MRDVGLGLGFARIGVASAEPLEEGRRRLDRWLAAGLAGELDYMARSRHDPAALMPGVRSVIVGALAHGRFREPEAEAAPPMGSVAAYARGQDYHIVLRDKLHELGDALAARVGRSVRRRVCVDTAELLEREIAARAGVGFIGKNTMLIAPGLGSGFLLGELLVDVEIATGSPLPRGCGSCRLCLDACPTSAFVEAHELDARRCISYLTIEHHGTMAEELRPLVGPRVFGCDACQSICPYNSARAERSECRELDGRVPPEGVDLVALLGMGNSAHRKLVKRTAMRRTSRNVLGRNAAVALAGFEDEASRRALAGALVDHPSALVRAHAAWALGQQKRCEARDALERAAASDPDADVRRAAHEALGKLDPPRG